MRCVVCGVGNHNARPIKLLPLCPWQPYFLQRRCVRHLLVSSNHAIHMDPTAIESKIRVALEANQIRTTDLFRDHDPLRTGFVTSSQFQRSIVTKIGQALTADEFAVLASLYDTKRDGRVHYRLFEEAMDHAVVPSNLERASPTKALGMSLSRSLNLTENVLADEEEEQFRDLFSRLQHHCKVAGIDIKACYEPFDVHHNGKVTKSQFIRAFPGPSTVTTQDRELIARKYECSNHLDVNYYKFFRDIEDIPSQPAASKTWRFNTERTVNIDAGFTPEIQELLNRIRIGFFRSRVRPVDYFSDHDKLHTGFVTENQFVCGLALACAAHDGPKLTRDEIAHVSAQFSNSKGQVNYRDFCKLTDKGTFSAIIFRSLSVYSGSIPESMMSWRHFHTMHLAPLAKFP
jgi:Ca2+-binding EF-hand superfamily protein